MNDEEVIEHVNNYYDERFKMHYVDPEQDISRLGLPLLIEWKGREELLEMYPE